MDLTKISCCPPENTTFSKTWMSYGISTCTMEVTSAITILFYVLIFGKNYLQKYKQDGVDIDSNKLAENSLYQLQKLLLILMPVFSFFNIIIHADQFYGYMIISMISSLIIYMHSIDILKVQKYNILSNKPGCDGNVLFGFWILVFVMENLISINSSKQEWSLEWNTTSDKIETVLLVSRYSTAVLTFSLSLLAPSVAGNAPNYSGIKNEKKDEEEKSTFHEIPPIDDKSSWKNTWYKFKTLCVFFWPKEDILLQLRIVACFALLLVGNVTNVLKPLYDKKIIDSVTGTTRVFRWELVVIFVGIDVFRDFAYQLRSYLWSSVEQHTTCKVEVEIFRHLHSLSLRWHLQRRTGEVLRVMDRGTGALHLVMYYIFFDILPTIFDSIVAAIFFISIFDKWLALIVFTSMIFYFAASVGITEWRNKIQERLNRAENNQRSRSVDSLLNFETVKYYGAESYEVESYQKAIQDSQKEQQMSDISQNVFYILQQLIDNFGLLVGSLLSLYMVANNQELTIGDYVLFTSYISQLQSPLNHLAYSYRYIHENFNNMQSLFDLFHEQQEIVDLPGAKPLKIENGQIQFSNVSFSYTPEKVVLKNVSFVVPSGKTVALVGPSGAGKSTIMRLLFRFYDVNEGSILIDGQDIKTVKQDSLRKAIGVVPQDTVLFNDTIKYNIRYGKLDASEEEVMAAAKHADIHDRILTFPDGYETEVGERGLRLSGGEKQRVAIARTILKAPKIVLLDEATSALDTQTERNIQAALNRVCANRTTIIIAHRLSTIIHADEILVINEGEIVERGGHEDLLLQSGVYYDMWQAQFKKEEEEIVEEVVVNDSSE